MDLNGNALCEQSETPSQKQQSSNGIRVRDMVRRYDTAVKSDSAKTSYSSIVSTKSSYFGVNASPTPPPETVNTNSNTFFVGQGYKVQDLSGSPSRSSCGSRKTVRNNTTIEMQNDIQVAPLETQKSFMNLSRSREPPKAAPREKKPRHSVPVPVPVSTSVAPPPHQEEHMNMTDSSYQSKTTISKTPNGVRIIIDIFFDQNNGLSIDDVVGSRVETDIPPSKILTEFQKRVAESSRN